MGTEDSEPVTLSRRQKILLFFIILLLPLVVGEILARIDMAYRNDAFRERDVQYTYLPYISYAYRPFSSARPNLETDRHGFIHNGHDRERDLQKKPVNEFRIFMLGGSTTAGTFVDGPQDTLSSRLERRLTETFQREGIDLVPRVVNAGVSSYFSAQELLLLHFVLLNLSPDYAIFFDGANDCHYRYDLEGYVSDETVFGLMKGNYNPHTNLFITSYNRMFSFTGLLRQAWQLLSGYSALALWLEDKHYARFVNKFDKEVFRIGRFLKTGEWTIPADVFKRYSERYIPDFTINVEHFHKNAKAALALTNSFPFGAAYFIQPTLVPGIVMSSSERKIAEPIMDSIRHKERCFAMLADSLAEIKAELTDNASVRVDDLRDVFRTKRAQATVYGDQWHYTNLGRQIIIDAMMASIGNHVVEMARRKSRTSK